MDVRVRESTRIGTMSLRFGDDVFEVSVLDLVAVAYEPEVGQAFFIGWTNFGDTDQWWADVRVQGEETVSGPDGELFDPRRRRPIPHWRTPPFLAGGPPRTRSGSAGSIGGASFSRAGISCPTNPSRVRCASGL